MDLRCAGLAQGAARGPASGCCGKDIVDEEHAKAPKGPFVS
jgi:hypothetical protein